MLITSIISHFSCMVSNLTRQLYRNFELEYKISRIADFSIFPKVVFMIALMSNPYAISHNSDIMILYFTHLQFTNN